MPSRETSARRTEVLGSRLKAAGSMRRSSLGEGSGAGLAFGGSACPAAAHVDGGLLFAGEALHEVVVAGALDGDRPAGSVLERVEIVDSLVADGVLLQIARGVGVLLRR